MAAIHSKWNLKGLERKSFIIAQGESDHCPISLHMEKVKKLGPIPFPFNLTWIQEEGVMDLIHQTWLASVKRSLTFVWESKLQAIKNSLRKWLE